MSGTLKKFSVGGGVGGVLEIIFDPKLKTRTLALLNSFAYILLKLLAKNVKICWQKWERIKKQEKKEVRIKKVVYKNRK